jgi:predicted neutral ceramidase superfamily lipid hydrolase
MRGLMKEKRPGIVSIMVKNEIHVTFVTLVTFVTFVTLVTLVTFVTLVTLVTFVTLVTLVTFVILATLKLHETLKTFTQILKVLITSPPKQWGI